MEEARKFESRKLVESMKKSHRRIWQVWPCSTPQQRQPILSGSTVYQIDRSTDKRIGDQPVSYIQHPTVMTIHLANLPVKPMSLDHPPRAWLIDPSAAKTGSMDIHGCLRIRWHVYIVYHIPYTISSCRILAKLI